MQGGRKYFFKSFTYFLNIRLINNVNRKTALIGKPFSLVLIINLTINGKRFLRKSPVYTAGRWTGRGDAWGGDADEARVGARSRLHGGAGEARPVSRPDGMGRLWVERRRAGARTREAATARPACSAGP